MARVELATINGAGGLASLSLTYNGSDPFTVQAVVPLGYDPEVGGIISFSGQTLPMFGADLGPMMVLAAHVNASGEIVAATVLILSAGELFVLRTFDDAGNNLAAVDLGDPGYFASTFSFDAETIVTAQWKMTSLPTSDPEIADVLYRDGDVVKVSNG